MSRAKRYTIHVEPRSFIGEPPFFLEDSYRWLWLARLRVQSILSDRLLPSTIDRITIVRSDGRVCRVVFPLTS